MQIREWIYKMLFGEKDTQIENLKTQLQEATITYSELLVEKDKLSLELNEYKKKVDELQNIIPDEEVPEKEYWNTRKPQADIYYRGRTIPLTKEMISNDVKVFITPNDAKIQNDIKKYGLLVKDEKSCNKDILKIYKHTRTKTINPYKYKYDNQSFGIGEYWMFPFELQAMKSGDCDDWSHELVSYLIGAGVPNWRVRVVCGTTYSNFGHSTVYVLADDLKTWKHLNSTTPISMITQSDLMQMPNSNNSADTIGIKNVWFSFNDEFAWHTFETNAGRDEFGNLLPNPDIIRIEPK